MKKTLILSMMVGGMFAKLNAQTPIFSEDFTGGMPSTFVLVNNDGKTPSSNVSFVNAAWVVRNESSSNTNQVAVSNSWYSPAGAADDWMITPQITIPSGGNYILKWRAKAVDPDYPDGYQVKVSTTGDTVLASFTTDLFTIAAENPEWTERAVSLTPYAGQTVRFAFRNNSNDMFLLMVDDISVFDAPANDMAVTSITNYRYYEAGNVSLKGSVKNFGGVNVTNYKLNWSYDGVNVNTQNVTGVNIDPYGTVNFTHNIPLAAAAAMYYPVKVWVSDVNGSVDPNNSNDTLSHDIYTVSSKPAKKTVIEEATGAWCQFCPDGAVRLNNILSSNPNAIGIAVHDGDGMSTPQSDSINASYATGFPSGFIDRFKFENQATVGLSRTIWSSSTTTRNIMPVPFGLTMSHTYNPSDRTVTVDLSAAAFSNISGRDYRFNVVVVQDSMSGSGSQWDQANFYDTQSGHPYFGAGNPIVGYQHRHVGRWWVGGVWGLPGSVPASVTDGNAYNKTITFALPADYDENKIYLVGMIQEYTASSNERPILNALEQKLSVATIKSSTLNAHGVELYPNPANQFTTVSFYMNQADVVTVQVLDITGKQVFKTVKTYNAGSQELDIDVNSFTSGTYMVNITTGSSSVSKKLFVK